MSLYSLSFDSVDEEYDGVEKENKENSMKPNQVNCQDRSPKHRSIRFLDEIKTASPVKKGDLPHQFSIQRKRKVKIDGIREYFYFYEDSNVLFSAKAMNRYSNVIPMCLGSSIHTGVKNNPYRLFISSDGTKYKLIRADPQSSVLFTLEFFTPHPSVGDKKRTVIEIFDEDNNAPVELVSARSSANTDGLDGFKIDSIKNLSLTDRFGGGVLISMNKITKDTMDCVSSIPLSPVVLFGIGISTFRARSQKTQ